ncbi:hypothetical protein [Namhaeicola litoreus]|uniref:Uncharacterized protein n=1 Tax=Namhaeicola litoreus TaxID=1052145 RepID=A0ABW3Y6C3_9FLAO
MKRLFFKGRFIFSIAWLLFYAAFLSLTSCNDSSNDEMEVIQEIEEEEAGNICLSGKLYNEKDGIIRVDIENTSVTDNGWKTENTLSGFEGEGYLVWSGNDNFNTPGVGVIKFSVQINNPGTYQFVWSSRITQGTNNTEHNDSWLRIPDAADFYGEKAGTGELVYPKGSGKTPNPEGSSSNGWFKVYMNNLSEWFWRSNTNDNDPYNIFAKFDTAGVYDIEISGRSKFHAIDQFVLFKTDKSLSVAQNSALSEIGCK